MDFSLTGMCITEQVIHDILILWETDAISIKFLLHATRNLPTRHLRHAGQQTAVLEEDGLKPSHVLPTKYLSLISSSDYLKQHGTRTQNSLLNVSLLRKSHSFPIKCETKVHVGVWSARCILLGFQEGLQVCRRGLLFWSLVGGGEVAEGLNSAPAGQGWCAAPRDHFPASKVRCVSV